MARIYRDWEAAAASREQLSCAGFEVTYLGICNTTWSQETEREHGSSCILGWWSNRLLYATLACVRWHDPLACSESDLNCTANGAWWQCFQHAVVGRENHPFHSRRSLSLLCRSAQLVHKNTVHTRRTGPRSGDTSRCQDKCSLPCEAAHDPVAKQMQQRNAIGLSTKLHLCVLTVLVMVL